MNDIENEGNLPREEDNTLGLLRFLLTIALVIPLVSVGITYLFFFIQGHELRRSEWKQIVFSVWLVTLCILVFYSFRRQNGEASKKKSLWAFHASQSQAEKWEQKNSRRLLKHVYLASIFLPLIGISVAVLSFFLMGRDLTHGDLKLIIGIYWISSVLVALRTAIGSRKSRTLFC